MPAGEKGGTLPQKKGGESALEKAEDPRPAVHPVKSGARGQRCYQKCGKKRDFLKIFFKKLLTLEEVESTICLTCEKRGFVFVRIFRFSAAKTKDPFQMQGGSRYPRRCRERYQSNKEVPLNAR